MIATSIRVIPTNDILYIRRVETEDTGRWSCKASNQFGEQKQDIHLTVTGHLTVHVVPQLQVRYEYKIDNNYRIIVIKTDHAKVYDSCSSDENITV